MERERNSKEGEEEWERGRSLKNNMKRERNSLGRVELKTLEDENGRGRVGERESFKERTRSNIDSKEL
jgi:hypothetical protein